MMKLTGRNRMRRQKYVLAVAFLALLYLYSMQVSYICDSFTEDGFSLVQREFTGRNQLQCTEQTNIVFIKCMKCATETIGTIIRRFGYTRDLNFVLPVRHNIYLGWPFPIEKSDFRPSKRPYNILMEHSIHNHTTTSSFMPKNTSYITIIRDPWNHFLSSFSYFGLRFIVAEPEINVTEYLSHIEKYETIYKSSEKKHFRECFPNGFSIIKNLMSHCMGMPLGFPEGRPDFSVNESAINSFINDLENQFSLVMIVDYFLESLVLLKRMLCWSFKDIVFHRSNVNSNKYQKLPRSGEYYKKFQNFSRVDFILYDHFNRTLWRKIHAEGPSFFDEVEQFRVVQLLVERFCFIEGNHNTKSQKITIPASRFNGEFNVTSRDCDLMNKYLLIQIRERYNKVELNGNKSAYWYANELPPKERPTRGCSFPKAQ